MPVSWNRVSGFLSPLWNRSGFISVCCLVQVVTPNFGGLGGLRKVRVSYFVIYRLNQYFAKNRVVFVIYASAASWATAVQVFNCWLFLSGLSSPIWSVWRREPFVTAGASWFFFWLYCCWKRVQDVLCLFAKQLGVLNFERTIFLPALYIVMMFIHASFMPLEFSRKPPT